MAKKPVRKKHVPQRTCVGCHEVLAKRSLVRIVRSTEAVIIDPTGKMSGRGAYLHNQKSCWNKGLQGSLAHALKTELSKDDQAILLAYMAGLPEDVRSE